MTKLDLYVTARPDGSLRFLMHDGKQVVAHGAIAASAAPARLARAAKLPTTGAVYCPEGIPHRPSTAVTPSPDTPAAALLAQSAALP